MPPTVETRLTLAPVTRTKLSEVVAERLLEEIRDRELGPGTRMPSERELMAMLGVGRSTVREALNGLAMLGAIEIRQGQGAFVATPAAAPADKIAAALANGVGRDLLEARHVVELETIALAAQRATPADVAELERVLTDHAAALEKGELAARYAAEFHLELAEAAHNELLAGFVASIVELLVERGPTLEERPGYREWELAEHTGLLEAVRARDPRLARRRMKAHLVRVQGLHEGLSSESGRA